MSDGLGRRKMYLVRNRYTEVYLHMCDACKDDDNEVIEELSDVICDCCGWDDAFVKSASGSMVSVHAEESG